MNWRVYGPATVATVLDKSELPGFWRTAVVGPDEMAIIVRDGKVAEIVTEARRSVSGLGDRIRGLFGLAPDVQVIMVNNAPFDLVFYLGEQVKGSRSASVSTERTRGMGAVSNGPDAHETYERAGSQVRAELETSAVIVSALTADRQVIQAEIRMQVSVEIERAGLLTGLLRGRRSLATWDLAAEVRTGVIAKVLTPRIAQLRADELRGNQGLRVELEQALRQEVQQSADLWGMTLHDVSVAWGLTEQEVAEISQARGRREEEEIEFTHNRVVREMERQLDLNRTRVQNLQEIKALEARGEEELRDLYLASEINREQMLDGQKVAVAKVDAQIKIIELDVERQQQNLKLEQDRARGMLAVELQQAESDTSFADDLRRSELRVKELDDQSRREMGEMEKLVLMKQKLSEQKHMQGMQRMKAESDHQFALRRQQVESDFARRKQDAEVSLQRLAVIERLLTQGMTAGSVNSGNIDTMLKQMTEQEYAQTSDAKVESRSRAQAAGNSVDLVRQEQDRARAQLADAMRMANEFTQSLKQPPSGQTPAMTPPRGFDQTSVTVVTGQTGGPPARCPNCAYELRTGWRACPNCGTALLPVMERRCKECGTELQRDWKACPRCGAKVS